MTGSLPVSSLASSAIDPSDSVPGGDLEPERIVQAVLDLPPDRFSNRELSWLNFNARVLALAEDRRQPLLERMKFLSIFASNLDEFYMVRVAGLKRRAGDGPERPLAGRAVHPGDAEPGQRAQPGADGPARPVLPGRRAAGAGRRGHPDRRPGTELDEDKQIELTEYFHSKIFPVLTPLAVDPAHPFPYISGLSLNLAVLVRDPDSEVDRFARVKVPNNVPRFVVIPQTAERGRVPADRGADRRRTCGRCSRACGSCEHHLFRVTRNTDFEVDEDRDEDLLQALERELVRRRFGPAVRLEVAENIDEQVLAC